MAKEGLCEVTVVPCECGTCMATSLGDKVEAVGCTVCEAGTDMATREAKLDGKVHRTVKS